MKTNAYIASVASILLLFAGCTAGPNYRKPSTKLTAGYGEVGPTTQPAATPDASPADANARISTTRPVITQWWTTFNDPVLNRFIDDARNANWNLKAAEARVRQARAQRGVTGSALYPTVDAGGAYTHSRNSRNTLLGAHGPTESDLWQAGFDANWEIDVFGGTRRSIEAADEDIRASVFDRNDVLLTLLGDVARSYIELRGFQRQIAIAEENLRSQRETLNLTKSKFDAGLNTTSDVARATAQVASTQSQVPRLEQQRDQAIHLLSVLTGREPQELLGELRPPGELPAPPPQIPVGIPSELLRRRPDIRRAEAQLHSATAQVGVATADLFPRFSLTGDFGRESTKFSLLGNGSSAFWTVGPTVSWPIFNAGRIRSQIRVQEAGTDVALANYEQAVLTSLQDVEDALVAYRQEFVRRESLVAAVENNQEALRTLLDQYQQGVTDFLNVLDAQRSLYTSQDELARSDTVVSTNAVALFKALGGGWEEQERSTAIAQGAAQ